MEDDYPNPRTYLPALGAGVLLLIGVYLSYQSARTRPSSIVLPGGNTYLGPTPTAKPSSQLINGKIPVPENATWIEKKGVVFPYTFTHPDTLSLGIFPNDPHDAVTIFYPGTDANANIFFRVEDLTRLNKTSYIGKPEAYARDWWKDYRWSGVSSVTSFTNSAGLKGYRAKYIDDKNQTPYVHVFFEVPGNNNLLLWANGRLLDERTFDRIIDSVAWKN